VFSARAGFCLLCLSTMLSCFDVPRGAGTGRSQTIVKRRCQCFPRTEGESSGVIAKLLNIIRSPRLRGLAETFCISTAAQGVFSADAGVSRPKTLKGIRSRNASLVHAGALDGATEGIGIFMYPLRQGDESPKSVSDPCSSGVLRTGSGRDLPDIGGIQLAKSQIHPAIISRWLGLLALTLIRR
jgi:hypothetical protein